MRLSGGPVSSTLVDASAGFAGVRPWAPGRSRRRDHASGGVGAERADELGRDELVAGAAALGPTTPAAAGSRAPQTDARCGSTPDPVGHYLGGRHGAFPAGRPIVSLTPEPVWRRALLDGRRAVSQGCTSAVSAGLPRRADRA